MVDDANGNRLSDGSRTMTWDSQNRLRSCAYDGATSTYGYGADGLRRWKSVTTGSGTTTTHYLLDGQNVAQEGHMELENNVDVFHADATYLLGPRGVEARRDESTGETRWYVQDGLGSVIAEVGEPDSNGNPVKSTCEYDVYGAKSETGTSASNHKFCGSLGHSTEDETGGLIYMRARWMDPTTGTFISEDPAGDGVNWYAYCGGNPVGRVDYGGKSWLDAATYLVGIIKGLDTMIGIHDMSPVMAHTLNAIASILGAKRALDVALEAGSVDKRSLTLVVAKKQLAMGLGVVLALVALHQTNALGELLTGGDCGDYHTLLNKARQ